MYIALVVRYATFASIPIAEDAHVPQRPISMNYSSTFALRPDLRKSLWSRPMKRREHWHGLVSQQLGSSPDSNGETVLL